MNVKITDSAEKLSIPAVRNNWKNIQLQYKRNTITDQSFTNTVQGKKKGSKQEKELDLNLQSYQKVKRRQDQEQNHMRNK